MEFYKLVQKLYLKGVHVAVLPLKGCQVRFIEVANLLVISDELSDKTKIHVLKEFLVNFEGGEADGATKNVQQGHNNE